MADFLTNSMTSTQRSKLCCHKFYKPACRIQLHALQTWTLNLIAILKLPWHVRNCYKTRLPQCQDLDFISISFTNWDFKAPLCMLDSIAS
jgi:hypothetical protein